MAEAHSRPRHLHTRTRRPCRPSGPHYVGALRRALRGWKLLARADRTSVICKAAYREGAGTHHSGYRCCGKLRKYGVPAAWHCWLAFFRFWRISQNRRLDQRAAHTLTRLRLTLELCASLSHKFPVQLWSKAPDSQWPEFPAACVVRQSFSASRHPLLPKRS